jgi:hypothetical protein
VPVPFGGLAATIHRLSSGEPAISPACRERVGRFAGLAGMDVVRCVG